MNVKTNLVKRFLLGLSLLALAAADGLAAPAARKPTQNHGLPADVSAHSASQKAADLTPRFPPGTRILFQGDSITDGGRGYGDDPNHIFGQDYAYLIAARCGAHYPDKSWTFINRGISGNKVTDLAGRWQRDALDLKPDILSVLVGVNDAAGGGSAEQYERVYDQVLQQALAANPNVQFVLGEPFVAQIRRNAEIQKRQAAVERLAIKYHAPVVHYQKVFNDAIAHSTQPITFWIWDGVHPTYAGHELMAEEWIRTVNRFYFSGKTPPRPTVAAAPKPKIQGALSFGTARVSHNASPIVLGWGFTARSTRVVVTSLGTLNDGATGAAATHAVGIYDVATRTPLSPGVGVTTAGGDLSGVDSTFFYVRLPQPLVLAPNTAHLIVGTEIGMGWLEAPQQVLAGYGIVPNSLHSAFHFAAGPLAFPEQTYAANDPTLISPNFLAAPDVK